VPKSAANILKFADTGKNNHQKCDTKLADVTRKRYLCKRFEENHSHE